MEMWIDAQLSPSLAAWLGPMFGVMAYPLRDLGLREADDEVIFRKGQASQAIILTKDADFLLLLDRFGAPPRLIWLTCGNTTNAFLKVLFERHAPALRDWIAGGEPLLEIG